jgi:hypothetical protein
MSFFSNLSGLINPSLPAVDGQNGAPPLSYSSYASYTPLCCELSATAPCPFHPPPGQYLPPFFFPPPPSQFYPYYAEQQHQVAALPVAPLPVHAFNCRRRARRARFNGQRSRRDRTFNGSENYLARLVLSLHEEGLRINREDRNRQSQLMWRQLQALRNLPNAQGLMEPTRDAAEPVQVLGDSVQEVGDSAQAFDKLIKHE